jgi:hypothetical protein
VVLGIVNSRAGPPTKPATRCAGDSPTDPHKIQRSRACRWNSRRTKAAGYARKQLGAGRWLRGSPSDRDSRRAGAWFGVNSAHGAEQVVEPTGRLPEVWSPTKNPEEPDLAPSGQGVPAPRFRLEAVEQGMAVPKTRTLLGVPSLPWAVYLGTRSGLIGLITLVGKCAGARSAGNPHAAWDVAGAGNRLTVRIVRHCQRKRGATAPALDPTRPS